MNNKLVTFHKVYKINKMSVLCTFKCCKIYYDNAQSTSYNKLVQLKVGAPRDRIMFTNQGMS